MVNSITADSDEESATAQKLKDEDDGEEEEEKSEESDNSEEEDEDEVEEVKPEQVDEPPQNFDVKESFVFTNILPPLPLPLSLPPLSPSLSLLFLFPLSIIYLIPQTRWCEGRQSSSICGGSHVSR